MVGGCWFSGVCGVSWVVSVCKVVLFFVFNFVIWVSVVLVVGKWVSSIGIILWCS